MTLTGLCRSCKDAENADRPFQMLAMKRNGADVATIAAQFGVKRGTVQRMLCEVEPTKVRAATMSDIIAVTSELTGFTPEELASPRRPAPLAHARQIIYFVGYKCGVSYPRIGASLGRDHSSAVYGKQTCETRMAADPEYADLVDRVYAAAVARKPLTPSSVVALREEPAPVAEVEADPEPAEELDEMELLSRAVAQHYAVAA